jgi:hypothetical protein
MKTLTKILLTSLALATPITVDAAYAQTNRPVVDSDVVRSGDRMIGRDPDPFIRGEMLRHYGTGYPN